MQIWFTKPFNPSNESHEELFWNHGATGKTKNDIFNSFILAGAKQLNVPIGKTLKFDKAIFEQTKSGDVIIILWPFTHNSDEYIQEMYSYLKDIRNVTIVSYLLDVQSIRFGGAKYSHQRIESKIIRQSDILAVHSEEMMSYLTETFNLFNKKYVVFGPFPYLINPESPVNVQMKNNLSVDYVGTLDKSKAGFLFKLAKTTKLKLNIFGVQEEPTLKWLTQPERLHSNINLYQKCDPEIISYLLNSSFGLIWDSTTYPQVEGGMGIYQKYNLPTKLSTYVVARQPVIAWSESISAKYVEKYHLGIVIDDLSQLDEKVASVSNEEYLEMVKNVDRFASTIDEGFWQKKFIYDVIEKVLE